MSEHARQAAGQAQEKAQEAGARAQGMLREQLDRRSAQAGERVTATAADLRSVGEELRKQGKEAPARIADQAAERTDRLGRYLSEADADRMLGDLEDFGRRRPWVMLAGGMAAGMAAARFLKASSSRRYQERLRSEASTREIGRPAVEAGAPVPAAAPGSPAPGMTAGSPGG